MGTSRKDGLADLLGLAFALGATREGLSYDEITARFDCSRRTAERMIVALRQAGLDVTEASDEQPKRWTIAPSALRTITSLAPDDLAILDIVATRFRGEGLVQEAKRIAAIAAKVRVPLARKLADRLPPDAAAIAEATGFAIRPGPRPIVDATIIETIRRAILARHRIVIAYRTPGADEPRRLWLTPFGLLFGSRWYLVAAFRGDEEPVLYRLDRIASIDILDDTDAPKDFDLATWAGVSFGVFREPPHDVVLRFSAGVTEDVRSFHFHGSQTIEPQPDGTTLVRFRAAGLQEIAWHLVTWGDEVEVISPEELRQQMSSIFG